MKYDRFTRILHWLVVLGVGSQMLTSFAMVYPKPGRPENQWYDFHESVGLAMLGVFTIHWLWSISRTVLYGETMRLFPWGSDLRRSELVQDIRYTIRELRQFRLPDAETVTPLPAAIQGLGLLLGLFVAATGTILFFGIAPEVKMSSLIHDVKEVHETAGSLLWVFLAIHPTMGVLHQVLGHKIFSRIFSLGR